MAETVREAFETLPQQYDALMGTGLNAVFQWDVTGADGGKWYAEIEAGTLTVHEGETDQSGLRITVAGQDWLDIVNHKLDYTDAYACGKVHMDGPLPLHGKVTVLFLGAHH